MSSSSCVKVSYCACCCSYTSRRPLASRAARRRRLDPVVVLGRFALPARGRLEHAVQFLCCSASSVGIAATRGGKRAQIIAPNCARIAQELRGVRDAVRLVVETLGPEVPCELAADILLDRDRRFELATVDQFLDVDPRHVVERRPPRAPARVLDQLGVVLPPPREPRGRDVVACFLLPLQRHTFEGVPPPRPRVRWPALLRRRRRRPVPLS